MTIHGRRPMIRQGWERLAPGVYADGDGSLHLFLSEMLREHGYEDTPENREQLIAAARDVFRNVPLEELE